MNFAILLLCAGATLGMLPPMKHNYSECYDDGDCDDGYCCFADIPGNPGNCYPCSWTVSSKKPVKDECHVTMNPCEGGYCCVEGACEVCKSNEKIECDNGCPPDKCCFSSGECRSCTESTTPKTSTTNGDVLPGYECDATHPCPDNYCCFWDQKQCILEASIGSCDIFSTTVSTTVTSDDYLPGFECDPIHPCPNGYCCYWEQKLCVSTALAGLNCEIFPSTSTTTTTITFTDLLPGFECDASHPCPEYFCCLWETKECWSMALVGANCEMFQTSTTTHLTTTTTTDNHVLPGYECDANHPCPDNYCCFWEQKQCILEASVGSCDIFSTVAPITTTTLSTTAASTTITGDDDDVLPGFECDPLNPCPSGYCCYWEQKLCISTALAGPNCELFQSTTEPTSTTTMGEVLPDYECDPTHPCPENYCCMWASKQCITEASVSSCDIFSSTTTESSVMVVNQEDNHLKECHVTMNPCEGGYCCIQGVCETCNLNENDGCDNSCPDGQCCFHTGECKSCAEATTPKTSTTNEDVIPGFECDATHPCPENYCCHMDKNQCISQASTESCDDFPSSSSSARPSTTTPIILPNFNCTHHNPCPDGYCCIVDSGACINQAYVSPDECNT